MTITNAIKKLEKSGFKVTNSITNPGIYTAEKDGLKRFINFYSNGGTDDICIIDLRTKGREDDLQSDYHAGTFCDNISQAIRYATTW